MPSFILSRANHSWSWSFSYSPWTIPSQPGSFLQGLLLDLLATYLSINEISKCTNTWLKIVLGMCIFYTSWQFPRAYLWRVWKKRLFRGSLCQALCLRELLWIAGAGESEYQKSWFGLELFISWKLIEEFIGLIVSEGESKMGSVAAGRQVWQWSNSWELTCWDNEHKGEKEGAKEKERTNWEWYKHLKPQSSPKWHTSPQGHIWPFHQLGAEYSNIWACLRKLFSFSHPARQCWGKRGKQ